MSVIASLDAASARGEVRTMWTLTLSRVRTVCGSRNGNNVSPEEQFWL